MNEDKLRDAKAQARMKRRNIAILVGTIVIALLVIIAWIVFLVIFIVSH